MKVTSTYKVRLVNLNVNVEQTLQHYRAAVDFFIDKSVAPESASYNASDDSKQ